MHRSLRITVLSSCALALAALNLPAQKRPITDRDLFAFNWIGDVQVAPDGHAATFVQASVSPDRATYQTSLYLLDLTTASAPVKLAEGTHDQSPRWSPDSKQIAFTRSPEAAATSAPRGAGGGAQLYLMPATPNGPIIKLSELPRGAGAPLWAPDGKSLLVTSSTPQDQAKTKQEATLRARATGDAAHVSDIKIINRPGYRFNGEGYLDPTMVPHLYLISLPDSKGDQAPAWQLSTGPYGVSDPFFTPDGKWLFYTSSHVDEPYYEAFPHTTLYALALPTGPHPKEVPAPTFTLDLKHRASGLALSPDMKHIVFHADEEGPRPISHQQTDLFIQDLAWTNDTPAAAGPARNLTGKLAYEMGGSLGGDNAAPRGGGRSNILWAPDSSHVIDVVGHRGSAQLVAVDVTTPNHVTELTAPRQAVIGYSAAAGTAGAPPKLIALISNPILIGDLFTITPNQQQTQLTDVNKTLFAQLDLQLPLDLEVTPTHHAGDLKGEKIDTFVQLPPGLTGKPASPLPFILNIHGGPHSAYGWIFDHEMLLMAARGYVVDYPNPRGSTTYGQNFANIIENNYPGDDYHDLMDTVDTLIKQGYADPNKLGVTGGSGGGLLTDWVVTQTTRFKAAVAQRDITDWANWWYTADAAGFHQSFYPKSPPFDNVELYRAHSPITFVNNVKTPMMFILGDVDYRTPPGAGGEAFFRALKYKHIPTVMVRFPRESHELSRSGEPWHRIERLDNIIDWFDKYLLNKPEPQYDLTPTPTN